MIKQLRAYCINIGQSNLISAQAHPIQLIMTVLCFNE